MAVNLQMTRRVLNKCRAAVSLKEVKHQNEVSVIKRADEGQITTRAVV